MTRVIKQGHADWDDLIGKSFHFLFYPGWDDPEWIPLTLAGIGLTKNEFGTPMYYLLDEDGGGYMQFESTVVEEYDRLIERLESYYDEV